MISIVIPCYNQGKYLSDCLKSVLEQTNKNFEVIIIDDGSTDNSRDIINKYRNKFSSFKYIYQENSGPSVARNKGIKEAAGEYVCFLDSDDIFAETKIQELYNVINKSSPQVICHDVLYFKHTSSDLIRINKIKNSENILQKLLEGNFITMPAFCIKKTLVKEVGYFSEIVKHHEDWEYFLRIAAKNINFYFLNKNLSFIRIHKMSASQRINKMIDSRMIVLNNIKELLTLEQKKEVDFDKIIFINSNYQVIDMIIIGDYKQARKSLFKIIKKHKTINLTWLLSFLLIVIGNKKINNIILYYIRVLTKKNSLYELS